MAYPTPVIITASEPLIPPLGENPAPSHVSLEMQKRSLSESLGSSILQCPVIVGLVAKIYLIIVSWM